MYSLKTRLTALSTAALLTLTLASCSDTEDGTVPNTGGATYVEPEQVEEPVQNVILPADHPWAHLRDAFTVPEEVLDEWGGDEEFIQRAIDTAIVALYDTTYAKDVQPLKQGRPDNLPYDVILKYATPRLAETYNTSQDYRYEREDWNRSEDFFDFAARFPQTTTPKGGLIYVGNDTLHNYVHARSVEFEAATPGDPKKFRTEYYDDELGYEVLRIPFAQVGTFRGEKAGIADAPVIDVPMNLARFVSLTPDADGGWLVEEIFTHDDGVVVAED